MSVAGGEVVLDETRATHVVFNNKEKVELSKYEFKEGQRVVSSEVR